MVRERGRRIGLWRTEYGVRKGKREMGTTGGVKEITGWTVSSEFLQCSHCELTGQLDLQ